MKFILLLVIVACFVATISCQRPGTRNQSPPPEPRGSGSGGRGPPIKSHGDDHDTPKWPTSDAGDSFPEPEPEPDFGEMLREFDNFAKSVQAEWRQLMGMGYGEPKEDNRAQPRTNEVHDAYGRGGRELEQYNEYGSSRKKTRLGLGSAFQFQRS